MCEAPPDPLFVLRGDMTPVHCLLFYHTQEEEFLYVGTEDGTVHIWNLKDCKRKRVLKISELTCLSLHMVDEHLLTQDKACSLRIYSPSNDFECIISKKFDNVTFCRISVLCAENTYLAIPQTESIVFIYSLTAARNMKWMQTLEYCDGTTKLGEVMHLKMFSTKDKYVAALYENGTLIIWDMQGNPITRESIMSETPMAFDFDTTLMQGVCGAAEKNIVVFRLDNDLKVTKRKTLQITNPGTGSLCVRPDGKILAAGCWDGKIRIFSWKTCKQLAALECHREPILQVSYANFPLSTWNNCKRVLAAASGDRKISLWNIYD